MYTERIVNRQIFYFFFMMRTTIILSFLPVLTSAEAMQDAWLAAIIAFFGSSAVVYAIVRLAVAFPAKSIIRYSQEMLGGVLALFAALVVAVLGADGGSQSTFPVFKMIRSIRISDFLERVESLTILAWGIGLFTVPPFP